MLTPWLISILIQRSINYLTNIKEECSGKNMGSCLCKQKQVTTSRNQNRQVVTVQRKENNSVETQDNGASAQNAFTRGRAEDNAHSMMTQPDIKLQVKDTTEIDGAIRMPVSPVASIEPSLRTEMTSVSPNSNNQLLATNSSQHVDRFVRQCFSIEK